MIQGKLGAKKKRYAFRFGYFSAWIFDFFSFGPKFFVRLLSPFVFIYIKSPSMDIEWRWVLLQVYFETEAEFLGKNLALERSGRILALIYLFLYLDPLCCSGCPWAAGSVEHLLCCYGNTSSGMPGKAAEMAFVEWRVKSGFVILLRDFHSCFCSSALSTGCLEV